MCAALCAGPNAHAEDGPEDLRGLLPRVLEFVFSEISRNERKAGDALKFVCRCTFLEIYNEAIYDLLDSTSAGLRAFRSEELCAQALC